MRQTEHNIQPKNLKSGFSKHSALFAIPNPYDDTKREKKGWFIESRKVEVLINSLRKNLENLLLKHGKMKGL